MVGRSMKYNNIRALEYTINRQQLILLIQTIQTCYQIRPLQFSNQKRPFYVIVSCHLHFRFWH